MPTASLRSCTASFRVVVVAVGLALAGLVQGCEARVSLGVSCEIDSDCPTDLVCRQGRCRNECSEARDCAFPLDCMAAGTPEAGGCRVPEDGSCRNTDDCAGDLVCEEGRCVQPCTDHSECSVAMVCNGTYCVRNATVGPCDVLSGTGCDAGERCGIVGMGAERRIECITLAVGEIRDAEENEACDANPDTDLIRPCRDGLTCVNGQCLRWCLYDETMGVVGSNCGTGSECVPTYAGATAPMTCGFCTEGCSPVGQNCVDETRTCVITTGGDGRSYGQCVASATVDCAADAMADGCAGRPCAMGQCALGLECVTDETAMTDSCLERCASDEDCTTGTCDLTSAVRVLVSSGDRVSYGLCR